MTFYVDIFKKFFTKGFDKKFLVLNYVYILFINTKKNRRFKKAEIDHRFDSRGLPVLSVWRSISTMATSRKNARMTTSRKFMLWITDTLVSKTCPFLDFFLPAPKGRNTNTKISVKLNSKRLPELILHALKEYLVEVTLADVAMPDDINLII